MEDLFYNYYGKSFCTVAPKVKLESHSLIHNPISAEKRNTGRTVKPRLTDTSVIRSPRYYGHFIYPPSETVIQFLVKNSCYYDQFVLAHW